MLYAEVDGWKRTAERSLEGYCPGCRSRLVPKCGELKTWHWAHHVGADCDPWPEEAGPWHLSWQEAVHPDNVEVLRGEHRADILGVNDTVIELQHSSISALDIYAREKFYGNMVWLFDATHRFRYVRTGNLVLFDVGKVKLNCCKKPVFLDFGHCIVEVQKFTNCFDKANGIGIYRDRSWFTNRYLSGLLRSEVKLVFSEDKKSHTWDLDCPYRNITHITKWWVEGKEMILPKGLPVYSLYDVRRLNDILEEFPEVANGWTKDGISKMVELLTGTPVIFAGLVRVMPAPVDKMKLYISPSEAQALLKQYEVHAKAGRVPILKPETKQRIIELAKKSDRPWYC